MMIIRKLNYGLISAVTLCSGLAIFVLLITLYFGLTSKKFYYIGVLYNLHSLYNILFEIYHYFSPINMNLLYFVVVCILDPQVENSPNRCYAYIEHEWGHNINTTVATESDGFLS